MTSTAFQEQLYRFMTGITAHSLHNEEAAEISEIPAGVWTSQVFISFPHYYCLVAFDSFFAA